MSALSERRLAHRSGGACWNCGNYHNKCCHIGKREFVIEQLLAVLTDCFVMMAGRVEASCRSCLCDWPNHHQDCKLAAVIKSAEEVLG